jgi:hypothetical protein
MFFLIFMMFLLGGTVCIMLPIMMPTMFMWDVFMGMVIMGIMMIWIGAMLYVGRSISTGGYLLNEMAKPLEVLTMHERRGGQGRFKRGRIESLEHIRVGKDMIFKDTGGGTRIGGHRIIKTNETVPHNIPDWAADYLYSIKNVYMVDNLEKLSILANKLKNLKAPIPGIVSLEEQLRGIPELSTVLQDARKKQVLLNMDVKDLRQMAELLYDGRIIHYEDYERFQESAAPYDLESYSKRRDVQRIMEMIHFRDINAPDWIKWVIIIFVLFVGAALAYKMIGG